MAISYFGNCVLTMIKIALEKLPPHISCTRLLFISQLLYNIVKTDINILNWMFIIQKIAIRITQFLRKSIIDTYLATRPAWISFFH